MLSAIMALLLSLSATAQGGATLGRVVDNACEAAVRSMEAAGVPCSGSDALPVVVWPEWEHVPAYSMARADRGFGRFLSDQIARRMPCATAARGDERDRLVDELMLQTSGIYDDRDRRFIRAGRDFQRSLILLAGTWWKADDERVMFTVHVYHVTQGTRVPRAVGDDPAEHEVSIRSVRNVAIRQSLATRVWINVPETFDAQTREELGGREPRASIVQNSLRDSLETTAERRFVVVADSADADVLVAGEMLYRACRLTATMEQILNGRESYGYRTDPTLSIRWLHGRTAQWEPEVVQECPTLMGAYERLSNAHDAYLQARRWLTEGDPRAREMETPVEWALRVLRAR